MNTSDSLRVPLNFVMKGREIWPEILEDRVADIGPADLRARCNDGFSSWILQTYVLMRQGGFAVERAPMPRPGFVNVVHPFFFGLRDRGTRAFLLACRADAHRPWSANFWLEQNGARGETHRNSWVPHWPQPGLIPRDAARGALIETLVFKGEALNFDARFRDPAFLEDLRQLGVSLRLDVFAGVTETPTGPRTVFDWHDYSTADLVIAARNLSPEDAAGKPASKLVNAWAAGVPALLGPEPAFREQRRTELDYIEIRGPDDVLAAVRALRARPELYRAMIANGRTRATEFTTARVLDRWRGVLNGPVRAAFLAWEKKTPVERTALVLRDLFRDRAAKRSHMRALALGPRILDAPLPAGSPS